MSARTFDVLTRRDALKAAFAASAAATGFTPAAVFAQSEDASATICDNRDVPDLQERSLGEVIDFEEITPKGDPAFPPGARAWRVLYVSTLFDNTQKSLTCQVVIAPDRPEAISVEREGSEATGRMVAWAHGTLGLAPRCQPARNVELEIWGPPAFGIGTVAWGSDAGGDRREGAVADGILAGMIGRGWIVSASDYSMIDTGNLLVQPYLIGKPAAANVIDGMRAAQNLVRTVYPTLEVATFDTVVWGHSQGGYSALWTGQLMSSYQEATAAMAGMTLSLKGVVLEAPGSNLVVDPATLGEDALGTGMFDWNTHAQLQPTGLPKPIPLAPLALSYVVDAWTAASISGSPDPGAMPAFPDVGELDPLAVITPAGLEAAEKVVGICWADGAPVVETALPFLNKAYLVPQLADGPEIDGSHRGNWDITCANPPSPALAAWCEWLSWQMPGPLGQHPMDKVPREGGNLVPILLATGTNDQIVHCVAPDTTADEMPSADHCVSTMLFNALEEAYCPAGAVEGSLTYLIWREQEGLTDAGHSDITGLVAAAGPDDLRFEGSPLEQFMTAAFDGTVEPGCRVEVVNGSFKR